MDDDRRPGGDRLGVDLTSSQSAAQAALQLVLVDPRAALAAAEAVLARDVAPAERAMALRAAGQACAETGRTTAAVGHLRAAVALSGRHGLVADETAGRISLSGALAARGQVAAGLRELDQALSIGGRPTAQVVAQRGFLLARAGREREALECWREALPGLRRLGDRRFEAILLLNRGAQLAERGELVAAERDLRRCAAIAEAAGLGQLVSDAQNNLGYVAALAGDLPVAFAAFDAAQAVPGIAAAQLIATRLDRARVPLVCADGLGRDRRDRTDAAVAGAVRTRTGVGRRGTAAGRGARWRLVSPSGPGDPQPPPASGCGPSGAPAGRRRWPGTSNCGPGSPPGNAVPRWRRRPGATSPGVTGSAGVRRRWSRACCGPLCCWRRAPRGGPPRCWIRLARRPDAARPGCGWWPGMPSRCAPRHSATGPPRCGPLVPGCGCRGRRSRLVGPRSCGPPRGRSRLRNWPGSGCGCRWTAATPRASCVGPRRIGRPRCCFPPVRPPRDPATAADLAALRANSAAPGRADRGRARTAGRRPGTAISSGRDHRPLAARRGRARRGGGVGPGRA